MAQKFKTRPVEKLFDFMQPGSMLVKQHQATAALQPSKESDQAGGEKQDRNSVRLLAARGDGATSLAAAVAINKSGQRRTEKLALLADVARLPGMTSKELAHITGRDRHDVAKRLPDLEDDSLVRSGEPRVCSQSTRRLKAKTWWITEAGKFLFGNRSNSTVE